LYDVRRGKSDVWPGVDGDLSLDVSQPDSEVEAIGVIGKKGNEFGAGEAAGVIETWEFSIKVLWIRYYEAQTRRSLKEYSGRIW